LKDEVKYIDDVEVTSEEGVTYNFTDGCGFISRKLANEINDQMGLINCTGCQFRFNGAKGVLIVNS